VATGQRIDQPLPGHTYEITSLAFCPDGKTLASGSEDTTIRLWNLGGDNERSVNFPGMTSRVRSMSISPDGKMLATVGIAND